MSGNEILDKHLEAVKENSKTVRNIYLSYLGFATYIWLTAESVTHLQLLIPKEGLSLPIIGIKLGVVGFFWVAPILLFLFHIYFALHVWKLAELLGKIQYYMPENEKNWGDKVPGPMFLWVFLEPSEESGFVSKLMRTFIFLSFWCIVPIVLLRVQWQFLPYHHSTINLLLQILITVSILISCTFYIKTNRLKSRKTFKYNFKDRGAVYFWKWFATFFRQLRHLVYLLICFTLSASFIVLLPIFSWTVLTIPKNQNENDACFSTIQKPFGLIAIYFKPELAARKNNAKNHKGKKKCLLIKNVIARSLVLKEKELALKPSEFLISSFIDKKADIFPHYKTLDLQSRNLEFADFSKADLRKADLRSARLQGANLSNAHLRGANLSEARLQGANMSMSQLLSADLRNAKLHGANFISANLNHSLLEGADLSNAQLDGASMTMAKLQGADLSQAQLQGAFLHRAHLQGAKMTMAHLQGANLRPADLQGADLRGAQLQGADLSSAKFQGAFLQRAQLQGAKMTGAQLQGADLSKAQLQGADLMRTRLNGANFMEADLGVLNISERKILSLINEVPRKGRDKENFVKRLRNGLGKQTTIQVSEDIKIRHSFEKDRNKQIQFAEVPSQTEVENLAKRKDIYRPLLCEHPVLINRNFESDWISPLSQKEVIDYVSENCPQHLPEDVRRKQGHPSTGSG